MAGGDSGSPDNKNTQGGKYLSAMNEQKQNKHIPGTKEFDPSKSPIDKVGIGELDKLIKDNLSSAIDLGNGKQLLELPKIVGTYKTKDGLFSEPTNRITIHNSRTGYHAVPARPKRS